MSRLSGDRQITKREPTTRVKPGEIFPEPATCVQTYIGKLILLASSIVILCGPLPASAWEFNIESSALFFRYVYSSQAGPNGFFGPFNTDNRPASSNNGDFAPLNGWYLDKMLSGTTAESSTTRFAIFPVFKINNAIALRGTYRINSDITTDLASIQNPDLENVISYGRWTRLWVTAETPLGTIYYGRRGFRQGCGLQFSSAESAEDIFDAGRRSVEMFLLQTVYGPVTTGIGFYPWRLGSQNYWNIEDQNAARNTHLLTYIKYSSGTVETGIGGFYYTYEEGPESQQTVTYRGRFPPRKTELSEGWIYLKYNDGRFFLNAEADWFYRTITYRRSQSGFLPGPDNYSMNPPAPSSILPSDPQTMEYLPPYTQSWRYMTESGIYSGPAKLSLLLAYMPGPDRRHGALFNTQSYVQEAERSAYAVFYQYGILMGKFYRAGVNSFLDMSASNVVAARFDYLLGTNLDLLFSVMKAERSSHGYGWGIVRPDTSIDEEGKPTKFGNLNFKNPVGTDAAIVPNIAATDLGWEFNVGFIWKLLENWHFTGRFSYWQPGKWFNYACVDKSVPNWDKPSSANNFGINPNRTIAPILGIELFLDARM